MKKIMYYCAKHNKKVHPRKAQKACVSCPYAIRTNPKQMQQEEEE